VGGEEAIGEQDHGEIRANRAQATRKDSVRSSYRKSVKGGERGSELPFQLQTKRKRREGSVPRGSILSQWYRVKGSKS